MAVKKPLTVENARAKAETLCARAEYSAGEIKEKLLRWGVTPSDASTIIDQMIKSRFIDDRRFARVYVRDKIEYARWGKRKVAMGLYNKRVSRDILQEALDQVDESIYIGSLRAVIDAKRRALGEDADTYEGRTKIFRYAASRGFEPDLIITILSNK